MLVFSQGVTETEDMMEMVDGAGNDSGILENRGASEPNRSGRIMAENRIVRQETPMSGKHWGAGTYYVSPTLG